MHARLCPWAGWRWQYSDGNYGHYILSEVHRYAGMICGLTPDGRMVTRPQHEFDALSHDGVTWVPLADLKAEIPWEGKSVRIRDVPLPE